MAKILKRYFVAVVAYDLGRILRRLLRAGKLRQFGDLQAALSASARLFSFAYFRHQIASSDHSHLGRPTGAVMPRHLATF